MIKLSEKDESLLCSEAKRFPFAHGAGEKKRQNGQVVDTEEEGGGTGGSAEMTVSGRRIWDGGGR